MSESRYQHRKMARPIIDRRSEWRRGARGGFTLLELVLVMILICTALAISAPDLRGYSAGSRMKNSAREVLALTNYARTQAASDGRVYRLSFDGTDGYSVMAQGDDGQFALLGNEMGRTFHLPDGVKVQVTAEDGTPADHIDFYPDGRADVARVHLSHDETDLWILSLAPSERFRITTSVEGGR